MNKFLTGQTATKANVSLKSSLKTMQQAKQCSVLWFEDIYQRKLYLELGYSSINQYARQELGFSSSRTGDYLQLCRSFKKLPKVRKKVETGELKYTSARVLAQVANKDNEDGWLDFALNHSRRDLEKEAKRAKRAAADSAAGQAVLLPVKPKCAAAAVVPVRISMEMSPSQFARYEVLWEQIRKQGHAPADKVEALLAMMDSFANQKSTRVEHSEPTKPPVQLHIHHCPECEKAKVQTSQGELEISKLELQQAQCDCQISHPGQRNTTSIPPAMRRFVLGRARHRCERPGCGHSHFLEVHHKIPRAQGGTNDTENLLVLCSTCHRLLHQGKFAHLVKSPQTSYRCNGSDPCQPIRC